jgi:hypothetical protein
VAVRLRERDPLGGELVVEGRRRIEVRAGQEGARIAQEARVQRAEQRPAGAGLDDEDA